MSQIHFFGVVVIELNITQNKSKKIPM